jgi:hypothetical protein
MDLPTFDAPEDQAPSLVGRAMQSFQALFQGDPVGAFFGAGAITIFLMSATLFLIRSC